jgi:hypothetical protein
MGYLRKEISGTNNGKGEKKKRCIGAKHGA